MTWDEILSVVGNIVGIGGAVVSVFIFFRTGLIKKSLEKKIEAQTKMTAYLKNKEFIAKELEECISTLAGQNSSSGFENQQEYVQRINRAVIKIKKFNPKLDEEGNKAVEHIIDYIKAANSKRSFSVLAIITDIQYLQAILEMEDVLYD